MPWADSYEVSIASFPCVFHMRTGNSGGKRRRQRQLCRIPDVAQNRGHAHQGPSHFLQPQGSGLPRAQPHRGAPCAAAFGRTPPWFHAPLASSHIPGQREDVQCVGRLFLLPGSHKAFVKPATRSVTYLPCTCFESPETRRHHIQDVPKAKTGSEVLKARMTTLFFQTRTGFQCTGKAMVV